MPRIKTRAKGGARKTAKRTTAPAAGKADGKGSPPRLLSDAQVTQVIGLLEGLTSVELKLTIPVDSHFATVRAVGLDPVETEPRQVYFFDTHDLALNKAGVVVRARRSQGGAADTVVKLRPVVPAELPDNVRRSGACKIELDVLPGGFVCSTSLRGNATGDQVKDAVDGKLPLTALFTNEQRAFFRKHAPRGVALNGLATLGPTFVLRSKFYVKRLDRKVVAEMWLYPDGSRILELSTKAVPREGFQVGAAFRQWLADKGIDTGGEQQTKTAAALRFFAARVRAEARRAARRR